MPVVAIDARDAVAPELRGWGRYARELIAALPRALASGIELRALERGGSGPEVLWEQFGLARRLRRERADLIHAPNCFLPLRRPCPGVVTIHDLAFEQYPEDFAPRTRLKYRALAPRAARSAERVICDTFFTRDDLCRRYGVQPERCRVIALAPALPLGDAEPPLGPYLLAVGDLRAKKNLGLLVRAWRALRAEGLQHRLVLAGVDGGEGPRLQVAAGSEPLELTGYISDSRLDALIRGADALVHPSLYEGFGLVLLEAMARGCPVLAANATCLPETGGGAAKYFDPHDADDLVDVLRKLLDSPSDRAELVRRGHQHVAAFSWARTARETAAVYQELL